MNRVLAAALFVAVSTGVAAADEGSARQQFDAGERAYNLGDFAKAVELFKQAYDQWPEPAFLFNIAQTYRQMGDCKQALFFYKRFLALKEQDTKKPIRPQLKDEVEKRIVELDECVKRDLANKPPSQLESVTATTATAPTGTQATTTTATAPTGPTETEHIVDSDGGPPPPPSGKPTMLSVRAIGGAAKLSAGDLDTKLQFSGALIGGYPLSLGDKLTLELGAAFGFTPVPYTTSSNEQGTSTILTLLANVAPSFEIASKLSLRADIGAGVLLHSGISMMGNPFTEGGAPASGTLSTFHLRTGVSGDYAVTPNFVITATPFAFSYSPAPSGFSSTISSVTSISFGVGVGYRR